MPTQARRIGDYEILHEIARGGMGVVYLARGPDGRQVALKTMLAGASQNADMVQRFVREARATKKLDHPNIVPVYDEGEADGTNYFAMAYIEGKSLSQVIDDGAVPVRRAMEIVRKVAAALGHAHDAGIIHRDIKPSNILLDAAGEPMLTDFGLARSVEVSTALTKSGTCIGTPEYMPPEQAQGNLRQVDHRADLYALGIALYELLTGKTPFEADNPSGTIFKLLTEDAVSPRVFNPEVDRGVEAVVLKLLEKNPDRRYRDAHALIADVDAWLAGRRVTARRPSMLLRLSRKARRGPWPRILAGSAAGLVFLTLVVLLALRSGADDALRRQWEALQARAKRHARLLTETGLQGPDPAKKLAKLDVALGLVPDWPKWQIDRAITRADRGDWEGALADATAAAENPVSLLAERRHAHFSRAVVLALALDRPADADAALAKAAEPVPGGNGHATLAEAWRASRAGDHAAARAALQRAEPGDGGSVDDVHPWERYLVAGLVLEAAGDLPGALEKYQYAVKSRSKTPTFALALQAMARVCRAMGAAGTTELPGRPWPDAKTPMFALTDPWEQALAALVEATRRAPSLVSARADLRALLTERVAEQGAPGLDPEVARLARALLAFCEGRADDARADLQAYLAISDAETEKDPPRRAPRDEATCLLALATWGLDGDAARARATVAVLAEAVVPTTAGKRAQEARNLAKQLLSALDGQEPPSRLPYPNQPLGVWANTWLTARLRLTSEPEKAASELTHLLESASGDAKGRPWSFLAVWPPAVVDAALLRLDDLKRLQTAEGQAEFQRAAGADLTDAEPKHLAEIAASELPDTTPEPAIELAATADPSKLRAQVLAARYAAELQAREHRTDLDLAACLAQHGKFVPAHVARIELALLAGDGRRAAALLEAADTACGPGVPALDALRQRVRDAAAAAAQKAQQQGG